MDTLQSRIGRWAAGLILGVTLCALPTGAQQNSCIDCHGSLDPPLQVTADQFASDIHAQKGLNCASCHGGDPAKADMDAMSKKAGFRGKPDRKQIPEFCGRCHSDAAYMRQYNPSLRTDQLAQYKTSIHGQRLAHGDTKVAVCIDCHSVHGIRPASDTRSTVNPLNVAQTCSHCHSNAEYMKEYKIPTDQFAKYSKSVHHEAMTVRGDLSAPTCTTCHGNHGAAPPGVGSVRNVCSTCHVFQSQMFDKSTHKAAFEKAGLPGCVVCHSNHEVKHPSDAMLSTGAQSVCVRCHTPGDRCDQATAAIHENLLRLDGAIKGADAVLAVAESSGMEVSEARLNQDQARDDLTKARVTIHSFRKELVNQDIEAGLKVAAANLQAGKDALKERDYRRVGLAISVFLILIVLLGLRAYIRMIERNSNTSEGAA
ncbi:MAG TPA: cytochrome c3 family protein [Patescibacteria group bacterium]|nr:cytochrome c3 family protein [Patescibacteria group bacterium]